MWIEWDDTEQCDECDSKAVCVINVRGFFYCYCKDHLKDRMKFLDEPTECDFCGEQMEEVYYQISEYKVCEDCIKERSYL